MFALAAGIGLGAALVRSQGAWHAEVHEAAFRKCIATLLDDYLPLSNAPANSVRHLTEGQIREARRKAFGILTLQEDCVTTSGVGGIRPDQLYRASGYGFTPEEARVPW